MNSEFFMDQADKANLEEFWRFIYERQAIWHRRFALKLPREKWTQDPILSRYKFTNVYRILDRGSRYIFDTVIKDNNGNLLKDSKLILWRIFCYRMINKIETFDAIGIPSLVQWDPDEFRLNLLDIQKTGKAVFTNAYITCQSGKKQSRIENAVEMYDNMHRILDKLWLKIQLADSLKQVHSILETAYGVGHFTSFQICLDMMYAKIIPFSEDDWADIGPGCKEGLRILFPLMDPSYRYSAMVWLRDTQKIHFERYGLDFETVDYDGLSLSLSNIENCLCEGQKNHKCRLNIGRSRIIFVPTTKV